MTYLAFVDRFPKVFAGLVFGASLVTASEAWAQGITQQSPTAGNPGSQPNQSVPSTKAKTQATSNPIPAPPTKPAWSELTAEQKSALKPLALQWNTLSEPQKRKWIRISQNFSNLSEPEQAKMHSRMVGWVSLSPKERSQARLNFAETNRLTSSEKNSNWEAYQALSPEEKKQLAAQGTGKPAGASAPIRPIPPERLSVVPVTQPPSRPTPKIAVNASAVQSNTLLPQVPVPATHETTEKN